MKKRPWWGLHNDLSSSVWTHCTLCTFDRCLHCDMDSFKLFWLPLRKWSVYLYASRENLTLLGAGQNTHLRSLIIAFNLRYPLTCQTAQTRIRVQRTQRLIRVFTVVRAHYWINLISQAMIRLHKSWRLIYASHCKKAIFLGRKPNLLWSIGPDLGSRCLQYKQ